MPRETVLGSASGEAAPSIVKTSGGYLAAWPTGGGLRVYALNRALAGDTSATTEATLSVTRQRYQNVSRDGTARLIVWQEDDGEGRSRVRARAAQGTAPFDVWSTERPQVAPAVADLGPMHLVVWFEPFEQGWARLRALRILNDGTPLDVEPLPVDVAAWQHTFEYEDVLRMDYPPSIVWSGRYFLVSYLAVTADRRNLELRLATITAGGVLIDRRSFPGPVETTPSAHRLVRAGQQVFAVWQEGERDFDCWIICGDPRPARLYGARFDAAGNTIGAPFRIAGADFAIEPDAAWNGQVLLVAWSQRGHIHAQQFDAGGRPYERMTLGSGRKPTVVPHDTAFTVAWSHRGEVDARTIHDGRMTAPSRVGRTSGDKAAPLLWRGVDGLMVLYERRRYGAPFHFVPRLYLDLLEP